LDYSAVWMKFNLFATQSIILRQKLADLKFLNSRRHLKSVFRNNPEQNGLIRISSDLSLLQY